MTLISKNNRPRLFGIALCAAAVLACVAVFAPLVSPHDVNEINPEKVLLAPSREFWLGTDQLGRCVLSRVLSGARTSLTVAVAVVTISGLIGTALGIAAANSNAFVKILILKILDVFLIIPGLIVSLVLAGLLGSGAFNLIVALGAVGWVRFAKTAYTVALSVREREFVTAARAMGASKTHIALTHLLPNVAPHILILSALSLGHTILSVSALSFLGVGVQPPEPEWGAMLYQSRTYFNVAPHLAVAPGGAIFLAVSIFLALGELWNRDSRK